MTYSVTKERKLYPSNQKINNLGVERVDVQFEAPFLAKKKSSVNVVLASSIQV